MKTWRFLHNWITWLLLAVLSIAGISLYIWYLLKAPAEFAKESKRMAALISAHVPPPPSSLLAYKTPNMQEEPSEATKRAAAVIAALGLGRDNVSPVRLHLSPTQRSTIADYLHPIRETLRPEAYSNSNIIEQRFSLMCASLLLQASEAGTESGELLDDITSAAVTFLPRDPNLIPDLHNALLHVLRFHAENTATSDTLRQLLRQSQALGQRLALPATYLAPQVREDLVVYLHLRGQVMQLALQNAGQHMTNSILTDSLPMPGGKFQGMQQMPDGSSPNWTSLLAQQGIFEKVTSTPGVPPLEELTGIPELATASRADRIAYFAISKPILETQKLYINQRVTATHQLLLERWIAEKLYYLESGQWADSSTALAERFGLNHQMTSAPMSQFVPLTYPKMQEYVNVPLGSPTIKRTPAFGEHIYPLLGSSPLQNPHIWTRAQDITVSPASASGNQSSFVIESLNPHIAPYYLSLAGLAGTSESSVTLKYTPGLLSFEIDQLPETSVASPEQITIILTQSLKAATDSDPGFPVTAFIPEKIAAPAAQEQNQAIGTQISAIISLPATIDVITYDGPNPNQLPGLYSIATKHVPPTLIHPRHLTGRQP